MDNKITEELKLLPAPDKSRYILYPKQKTGHINIQVGYDIPKDMTQEQEKRMADALAEAQFRYIEKELRKFLDDFNSLMT